MGEIVQGRAATVGVDPQDAAASLGELLHPAQNRAPLPFSTDAGRTIVTADERDDDVAVPCDVCGAESVVIYERACLTTYSRQERRLCAAHDDIRDAQGEQP